MGACFSTANDSSSSSSSPTARSKRRTSSKSAAVARHRPAGRSVPEPEAEETVKEVLSETPKTRLPKLRDDVAATAATAYADKKLKQQQQQQRGLLALDKGFSGLLVPLDDGFCSNFEDRSEDASEAFSESLSASTATVTEKQDPGEVEKVRRRSDRSSAPAPTPPKYQRKRSVSGEFSCRRESSVAVRCGSDRSAQQSPARRAADTAGPAVARTNSSRDMGHAASRIGVTSGARREPWERSGRRSVSPAAKRVVEARHNATALASARVGAQYRTAPGARTSGRASPRRVLQPAEEPAKQIEQEKARKAVADSGEEGLGEGNESLDNPLVSLECFIFL